METGFNKAETAFIVIESLDGAGGTTQANVLARRMRAAGLTVLSTSEPTNGAVGQLIRRALGAELQLTPQAMALLFAADRHEHVYAGVESITAALQAGISVVCDRYVYSSLAYQSLDCGWEFVMRLNAAFPPPTDLVYLALDTEVCQERLAGREHREIYEETSIQRRVEAAYEKALGFASEQGVRLHRIDGSGDAEQVSDRIWNSLASVPILEM